MTFAEAAIEVLYRAQRPLHYKKITEAAIQEQLLSHKGRTPENTMGERLTKESKKTSEPPVESIRPGVYKLRDEYEKKLEKNGRKRLPLGKKKPQKAPEKKSTSSKRRDSSKSRSQDKSKNGRQARSNKSNGRNDKSGKSGNRRRRRRSRSKKNGRDNSKRQAKSSDDSNQSRSRSRKSNSRRRKNGRSRSKSRSKSSRRSSDRKSRKRRSSSKSKSRSKQRKPAKQTTHLEEGPVRMDAIAQAAHTVLDGNKQRPMKIADLADEIFDRKLVRFHTHDAAATVQSAMAGDNQLRKKQGNRPLFIQYDRNRWGLTKWGLSEPSVEREQSILSLAEEIRQDAVETLGEALTDIKAEAIEHLALTLLERLGYQDIKVSKRSSDGDVFFTSDWRQGLAEVRVCIQVVGDNDLELSDDLVTELRGTLHHYSASEGVIIHLGDIDDDAIEESREEKLAPITLIDRDTFVELLIKHGLGVRTYQAPVTMVDTAFIDALASA